VTGWQRDYLLLRRAGTFWTKYSGQAKFQSINRHDQTLQDARSICSHKEETTRKTPWDHPFLAAETPHLEALTRSLHPGSTHAALWPSRRGEKRGFIASALEDDLEVSRYEQRGESRLCLMWRR
jgi:hypothetical protein